MVPKKKFSDQFYHTLKQHVLLTRHKFFGQKVLTVTKSPFFVKNKILKFKDSRNKFDKIITILRL
jgi:hypothetical protein